MVFWVIIIRNTRQECTLLVITLSSVIDVRILH